MQFSETWLRTWVNPPIDTSTLAQQLTMAGLEVTDVKPVAGEFHHVVVGRIILAEPHPNAERLRVCQVDVGAPEVLVIVCGAANARAHLRVAVALVGATLPGDFQIKTAKLRGVASSGMLCSASELGLESSAEGILELPEDAPIGCDLREYLSLNDHRIEVDLTPNRGDCLSVLGVAREVAAINALEIPQLPKPSVSISHEVTLPVCVVDPNDCPHYVGRVIQGIQTHTPTPLWLSERLRRGGMRSVDLVVDVTNYVLLELGQPMHAFDLTRLQGEIVVRRGKCGESLTLIDGRTVTVDEATLLIADAQGPLALAGIMGGLDSAITSDTNQVFLESAYFNPLTVAGRARHFGLSTEGSHRFERGVSPELQVVAIERATELIVAIAGGAAGPLTIVRHEAALPKPPTITVRRSQIPRLLGIHLPDETVVSLLHRLNLVVNESDVGWSVTPPVYRFDVQHETDVLEEVARLYGYHHIPATVSPVTPLEQGNGYRDTESAITRHFNDFFTHRGYHEAITYSFVDPRLQSKLHPDEMALPLVNPISPELSVMRTSLWSGLLQALTHNQSRQQSRVRLFEAGLRFCEREGTLMQEPVLAGLISDTRYPPQWGYPKTPVDFFDLKADIEGFFASISPSDTLIFKAATHPALHPGQTAELMWRDQFIGYLGALHPLLAQSLDITTPVYLFEFKVSQLHDTLPVYQPLSKFPAVRRDLALVVDQTIESAALLECIKRVGGDALRDRWIFDCYQGEGIAPGKKSIAIGLLWQRLDRTLCEEEIAVSLQAMMMALNVDCQAVVRDCQ